MKKFLIFLIVLAILALFMKVTVPAPEKHHDIAKVKLNELFKDKASSWKGFVELVEGDRMEEHMYAEFIVKGLKIKDYFVCNAAHSFVDARFQVCFTPLEAVLFAFPSRYLFAIGHRVVFSLGGWSPRIRTEFHVLRPTRDAGGPGRDFG